MLVAFESLWGIFFVDAFWSWLPYTLRKFLTFGLKTRRRRSHVSRSVRQVLDGQQTKRDLTRGGFSLDGRMADPLCDVPRWQFERLVDHGISNTELFRQAFIASSVLSPDEKLKSYERLEYLGDAILSLVVREWGLARFPIAHEGTLTSIEARLVDEKATYTYARHMGLEHFVVCNAHDMRSRLHYRPRVLGDAFESMIGALYLDQGLEPCRKLILKVIRECNPDEDDLVRDYNFKQQLIRLCSRRGWKGPKWRVKKRVPQRGIQPPQWVSEVRIGQHIVAEAAGLSLNNAENCAAEVALDVLKTVDDDDQDEQEQDHVEEENDADNKD